MFAETLGRIKDTLEIQVEVTDAAIDFITEEGYDTDYGARPLRRAIQTKIEDFFSEKYLDGKFSAGDKIIIDARDNEIVIEKKSVEKV